MNKDHVIGFLVFVFSFVWVFLAAIIYTYASSLLAPISVDGAWDCYHSTATQQYEETGWECINRSNRDERVNDLQTEMLPTP